MGEERDKNWAAAAGKREELVHKLSVTWLRAFYPYDRFRAIDDVKLLQGGLKRNYSSLAEKDERGISRPPSASRRCPSWSSLSSRRVDAARDSFTGYILSRSATFENALRNYFPPREREATNRFNGLLLYALVLVYFVNCGSLIFYKL